MTEPTFDPDSDDFDVADVISLLPPDPPFSGAGRSGGGGAVQGVSTPVHRYQKAANDLLAANEPVRDRLERDLGRSKADEAASFENLMAETKAQASAEDDRDDAVVEASRPEAARAELGLPLALGATAAVALGQWWIDHSLLLSSFPNLSRMSVNCLALMGVAGSMVSAHVAGAAAKDIDFEPPLDPAAATNRRNKVAGSMFGVGIEVLLALVRATKTGAVLTSVLLGAAGLALWVFARSVAYRHRSKELTRLVRATKAERKARARATNCRRRQVDVTARHALTHRKLIARARGVVDQLVHLAQEAEAAWARVNPSVPFPGVSAPGAADDWQRYAEEWLPDQLRLPIRQLPSLEDHRRKPAAPARRPHVFELPPGPGR